MIFLGAHWVVGVVGQWGGLTGYEKKNRGKTKPPQKLVELQPCLPCSVSVPQVVLVANLIEAFLPNTVGNCWQMLCQYKPTQKFTKFIITSLQTNKISWLFMIIHDYSWLFMIIHDYSWLFMIIHDCQWWISGLQISPKRITKGPQRGRLDIRHGHPHLSGDFLDSWLGPMCFRSQCMGNVFIISLVLYVFICWLIGFPTMGYHNPYY